MKNTTIHKQKSFENFFNSYFNKIKSYAKKLLKSDADAEDIAQDIFIKLWNKPEIWIDKDNINDAYIFSMVKNNIFNRIKHQTIINSYQQKIIDDKKYDIDFNIYDNIYAKELKLLIKLTLEKMPEQRKNIFKLSREKGLSNKEIADLLKISVRTVERHIYLALIDIKKVISLFIFLIW